MRVICYEGDKEVSDCEGVTKAETIHIDDRDGQQFRVFILDADDSLDLVVHYPNAEREIVWSVTK